MEFDKDLSAFKFGKNMGFILAYFLFTTILYFLLSYLGKLPMHWNYGKIATVTFLIVLIGWLFRRLLK